MQARDTASRPPSLPASRPPGLPAPGLPDFFDPPSPLRILAPNFLCEMAFRDPAGQLNMLNDIICLVRPEIDPDGKT